MQTKVHNIFFVFFLCTIQLPYFSQMWLHETMHENHTFKEMHVHKYIHTYMICICEHFFSEIMDPSPSIKILEGCCNELLCCIGLWLLSQLRISWYKAKLQFLFTAFLQASYYAVMWCRLCADKKGKVFCWFHTKIEFLVMFSCISNISY